MSHAHEVWRHTLGDLLRRTAARLPGKTAVICGEVRWTYAELDRITNRLANGLAARGLGRGDRVAILSRNSHAFVVLRFALGDEIGDIISVTLLLVFKVRELVYVLNKLSGNLF